MHESTCAQTLLGLPSAYRSPGGCLATAPSGSFTRCWYRRDAAWISDACPHEVISSDRHPGSMSSLMRGGPAMSEIWAKWEGQIVNGVFPLRRFLGGSDHSGVFLTESKARNLPNAALKLIPAIPTLAEAQLAHWTAAAALSHPRLLRLLEAGRCHLGGLQFLFVVMEYADQALSQILPQRALTPDEVRDMLIPILSGLAFLHRERLVQGRLRPSNILVVGDQLKLASDTIRPAGESSAGSVRSSVYDPPEASDGGVSAAGDTRSLGVIEVEALTQHPLSWPVDKGFVSASL